LPIKNPQKRAEAYALVDALQTDFDALSKKYVGVEVPQEALVPIFSKVDSLHGLLRRNLDP
jgi:hypothetical protein